MVIGRNVTVSIVTPDGDVDILAKVDTGACNSSLDEELFKNLNLDEEIIKNKIVRSAHGEEIRNVYSLDISVGGEKISSEVNISDRKNMKYKMILGRNDIEKLGAIVDVKKDRIKRFEDFSKIEEGFFQNLLLSSLISLGVINSSDASTIKDSDKIEKLESESKDISDIIKFINENNIELDRKYNFHDIKNKFESRYNYNFEKTIKKLNPKISPISVSVFTFSDRNLGLTNIPLINVGVNVNSNLRISFWDSGWFRGNNMIGGGVSIKF
jgi:hypothetical protein